MHINELTDDLRVKIRVSFLIYLQNCLEIDKGQEPLPEWLALKREKLRGAMDSPETQEACDALLHIRNELIKALRELNALHTYQKMVKAYMARNIIAQLSSDTNAPKDAAELFASQMEWMLKRESPEQNTIDASLLSMFVSVIPLRMATGKYYDYVCAAFNMMDTLPNDETLADYQRLFCPMDHLSDDCLFPAIKKELDSVWESVGSPDYQLDDDKARQINQFIEDALYTALEHINKLFDAVSAGYLTRRYGHIYGQIEEDENTRSLYEAFKAGTDREALAAKLDAAIDNALSHVVVGPLEDVFDSEEYKELSEDSLRVYEDWSRAHEIFYETSMDYFNNIHVKTTDWNIASMEDFQTAITDYMKRCTSHLSADRKRFLRQFFLSYLPYPYDLTAYRQYFLDTYESLDEKNRIIMIKYINQVMAYMDKHGKQ